jgi:hypothetical protein
MAVMEEVAAKAQAAPWAAKVAAAQAAPRVVRAQVAAKAQAEQPVPAE